MSDVASALGVAWKVLTIGIPVLVSAWRQRQASRQHSMQRVEGDEPLYDVLRYDKRREERVPITMSFSEPELLSWKAVKNEKNEPVNMCYTFRVHKAEYEKMKSCLKKIRKVFTIQPGECKGVNENTTYEIQDSVRGRVRREKKDYSFPVVTVIGGPNPKEIPGGPANKRFERLDCNLRLSLMRIDNELQPVAFVLHKKRIL